MKQRQPIKAIIAWCFYDFAAASFSIIVTTFIFATYFTTHIAADKITGTYQWANAISIAGLVIAFGSPLLGAIADHGGHLKRWLACFTLLCIVATGLLWFAYPNITSVYFTLVCVALGTIGLEVALVFYNAFLPHIAKKQTIGRVSGIGWGFGYLGGIIALTITLIFFIEPKISWFDTETAAQVRICGPFVALWFGVFSLPLFLLVPDVPAKTKGVVQAALAGWRELVSTVKRLPQEKNIFLYLFAHMIYTDGLNTLFAFGGIYAAGTYGLSITEVLLFGISMNVTAGLGAILLSWVDDYLGSKKTILISLVFLSLFGIPILFLHDKYIFWVFALLLCIFVGPVQSASRALMVHLLAHEKVPGSLHSPELHTAEMFGLYALSGKITAFIGPFVLGMLTLYSGSQRLGMATVIVFFIIGGMLLLPVRVQK